MKKKTKRIIVIAAAAVLLIAAAVTVFLVINAGSAGYRSISIAEIFGKVMTQNDGKTYVAYKNMRLADGYALTTDPNSYTRMVLDDDKYVKLEQESHAIFEALGDSKRHLTTIRLDKGALTTEITKPLNETESYVVNTPNAVLAVRGTLFRIEVKQETNGDYYCDVYTYGGAVVSHRIMPDGTHVDEEIVIPAGYKATIKMDEIVTVYLEEKIEETTDNIDPLSISEVGDDDLVDMYNASRHGHEMFVPTEELWKEIEDRDIDLDEYKSVYDGKDIPPFNSGDTSDSDSSNNDSEGSSDNSEISDSFVQGSDISSENSSNSIPESSDSSYEPSGSDDDNTHEDDPVSRPVPDERPEQSSSASLPVSEPTFSESIPTSSENSVSVSDISGGTSSETSSTTSTSEPVESSTSSSTDSGNSGSSDNTSSEEPPSPPMHIHTPEETRVEPTCTGDGRLTRICSVCGELMSETAIPAKGHSFGEYVSNKNATCLKDGTKSAVCEVCGEKNTVTDEGSKLPHTPETFTMPSTCIEHGSEMVICKVCEFIIMPLKELPLAEHTIATETKDATCTEAGVVTTKCSVCGEILKETVIPAAGHSEVTATVPATCTEAGKTTVKCSACGEILTETVILAKGHTEEILSKPSTCTVHGTETVVCSVCERIISTTELPLAEHSEITETTDPTCTEDGKTVTSCEVCKAILKETVIDALGHDYEDKITEPASCTEEGEKVEVCARCGEEKPDSATVIEKLPHTEVTEEADGIRTVKCSVCGEIITQTDLATGIVYPVVISDGFPEFVPQNIAALDSDNDGKLSLDECKDVTDLAFTDGELYGGVLEKLEMFPDLNKVSITAPITDGNLSIGALDGINDANISNVTGGEYPSDTAGVIKGITEGTDVGFDFTPSSGKTIPIIIVPAEGSTFAPETPPAPEGVAIDATNFPDEFFRQDIADVFDKNSDGYLSDNEINFVDEPIFGQGGVLPHSNDIVSLEGIKFFTAMDYVLISGMPQLKSIDFSDMKALQWIEIDYCDELVHINISNMDLSSINIRECDQLTDIKCNNSVVFDIDVSNCPIFETFDITGTRLEALTFTNCGISTFDLSAMKELTYLDCQKCHFSFIDISNNPNISTFLATGCEHAIHVENGVFDLNSIDGFDISRMVDGTLSGATMDENGVLSGITEGTNITYTYDCKGTGESKYQVEFTLVPDDTSTFEERVWIESTVFSDPYFMQYISDNVDEDKNGYLTTSEIAKVTEFDLSGVENIMSLDGIEYFTELKGIKYTVHVDGGNLYIPDHQFMDGHISDFTGGSFDGGYYVSDILRDTEIVCNYNYYAIGGAEEKSVPLTLIPDESSTFANDIPEGVEINASAFPDENFMNYVTNFDFEPNGYLSTVECEGVTELDLTGEDISSIEGFEIFTNLATLKHKVHIEDSSFDIAAVGIDVSKITSLAGGTLNGTTLESVPEGTEITFNYMLQSGNTVAFTLVPDETSTFIPDGVAIDANNFPDEKFRSRVTYKIDADRNGYLSREECDAVTEIDGISGSDQNDGGITSLVGIENFRNLKYLHCGYNSGLTSLDVSKNTMLETLICGNTSITLLDVSKNAALTELYCYNTQITSLDVSKNTALTALLCNDTKITSLDVSKNTALTDLRCYNTQIPCIDISNNSNLYNNPNIKQFYASGCKYPIPQNAMSFDGSVNEDFIEGGFIPSRVSNVVGADYNPANGIFYNFTADEITYTYDCKGTGESKYMETFTLVRTDSLSTASIYADDEDDTFAVLPPDDTTNTTPPSSADTGSDTTVTEDAALPPEDIEGLRFLPLGILALMRDSRRKTAFRFKRKAEI